MNGALHLLGDLNLDLLWDDFSISANAVIVLIILPFSMLGLCQRRSSDAASENSVVRT